MTAGSASATASSFRRSTPAPRSSSRTAATPAHLAYSAGWATELVDAKLGGEGVGRSTRCKVPHDPGYYASEIGELEVARAPPRRLMTARRRSSSSRTRAVATSRTSSSRSALRRAATELRCCPRLPTAEPRRWRSGLTDRHRREPTPLSRSRTHTTRTLALRLLREQLDCARTRRGLRHPTPFEVTSLSYRLRERRRLVPTRRVGHPQAA